MAYRTIRTETTGGGKTRVSTKVEYYETIQEREQRRKAKLMEKAVKTATQPVIAGIEVSQEVYNDYSTRTYKTSVGELPYRTLELYATGAGIAETHPEISEECKAIREQIRAEIAAENKRIAEMNVPKHKEFTGYLEDLGTLYNDATSERKQMVTEHKNAMERLNQAVEAAANSGEDSAGFLKAKADRAAEIERYNAATDAFHEKVSLQIDTVRQALKARVSEFYDVDAEKLDDNVIKLLNSGLRLTEHELNDLFNKFADNTTMLRMIADYCQEHDIDKQDAAVYGHRAKSNGKHEFELFEGIVKSLELATGYGSDVSERVWSPENGHFENLLNNSINELKQTLVKP